MAAVFECLSSLSKCTPRPVKSPLQYRNIAGMPPTVMQEGVMSVMQVS